MNDNKQHSKEQNKLASEQEPTKLSEKWPRQCKLNNYLEEVRSEAPLNKQPDQAAGSQNSLADTGKVDGSQPQEPSSSKNHLKIIKNTSQRHIQLSIDT